MNRNRGSNRNVHYQDEDEDDQSNQNDSKEAVYNNQLILSFPFLFFLIHPIIKQTILSIFNDFISIGCYFSVFVFFFFFVGLMRQGDFIAKLRNFDENGDGIFNFDEFKNFCKNTQDTTNDDEIMEVWHYFGGTDENSELTIKQMSRVVEQQV